MSRESDDTYFVNALREFLGLQPIAYTSTSADKSNRGPQKERLGQYTLKNTLIWTDGCSVRPKTRPEY